MKCISLPKLLWDSFGNAPSLFVRSLSMPLGWLLHLDALEIGIVESELDNGLLFFAAEDSANLLVESAVSDSNAKLVHDFLFLILENNRKVDADEIAEMKEEPSLSESSPRSMMSMTDGEMVCASSPSSCRDFVFFLLLIGRACAGRDSIYLLISDMPRQHFLIHPFIRGRTNLAVHKIAARKNDLVNMEDPVLIFGRSRILEEAASTS